MTGFGKLWEMNDLLGRHIGMKKWPHVKDDRYARST